LAIAAAGVAARHQQDLHNLYEAALGQEAANEFWNAWNALHNSKSGSSSAQGLANAQSGSTSGSLGRSNGGHSGGSGSGGGGTGTGNGASSNRTTVDLAASQSQTTIPPAITALLVGLLVLTFLVVAMAVMRRNAARGRTRVASAGEDEGAE
jgi:hypothetical protein